MGESLLTEAADKARYNALAEELRCLVCQNQTLADSDASLAVDLRRQLESMVVEGRSDDEIKSYLVDRYGEFVLYRPPVQSNTWLLWFGPFVLLAAGIGVWLTMQRRRETAGASSSATATGAQGRSVDRPDVAPSGPGSEDIERARRLLDGG
ncbi:MAG TPA: cytochrome c-type biogenesis protein CcmH [Burkholderiaceae bacterium]|nr:cytochrome c-type biogenesis protein CcmH [Burkholderiaceae bacterium]